MFRLWKSHTQSIAIKEHNIKFFFPLTTSPENCTFIGVSVPCSKEPEKLPVGENIRRKFTNYITENDAPLNPSKPVWRKKGNNYSFGRFAVI